MHQKQKGFIQVEIGWVRRASLSRAARLLYPLLRSYADFETQQGLYVGVHPGLRRLSRELHCNHQTVARALIELQKDGLVRWTCNPSGSRNYVLFPSSGRGDKWVQIPTDFLRNGLLVGPKLTYIAIHTFDVWGALGEGAYPRRIQLQHILGCSESGLRKWLTVLQEKGLLRIEDDGQYVLTEVARYEWNHEGDLELVE